jgi:hypothetical protein
MTQTEKAKQAIASTQIVTVQDFITKKGFNRKGIAESDNTRTLVRDI